LFLSWRLQIWHRKGKTHTDRKEASTS